MDVKFSKVGIVGGGALGQAIKQALEPAGVEVLFYDKDPEKTTAKSVAELVEKCQVLLLCAPSWANREIAKEIADAKPAEPRLVVSLAKGVEAGFVTMDQVLRETLPETYAVGVMYGPMLAGEIAAGKNCFAVLALSDTKWAEPMLATFQGTKIVLETDDDPRSVALCAVLKNVYAVAFGICDGLGLGLDTKGKLTVAALREMKQILADLHAEPSTAEGNEGLGDLIATGCSGDSFNYQAGKKLAASTAEEVKSEGLTTLAELSATTDMTKYPLASALHAISQRKVSPAILADIIAKL